MVTGSVASMTYGEPRLTLDVDLAIELDAEHASHLLAAELPLDHAFFDAELRRRGLEAEWGLVTARA